MSFWSHLLDQNINEKIDKFCPRMGRAEFIKFFVGILVQTMTPEGHFEINWPLKGTSINEVVSKLECFDSLPGKSNRSIY